MSEKINESVKVVAEFGKGQLKPLYFSWRGRNYPVKGIEFIHWRNIGESKIYSISLLSNNGTNYLLEFNSVSFVWRLIGAEIY